MTATAYDALTARFRRLAILGDAQSILNWDWAAMMPAKAAAARTTVMTELSRLRHEGLTAPEMADWLDEAETAPPPDPWHAANLKEMRRLWRHAAALPGDLVAAMAEAGAACEMVWRTARGDDDFAAVAPKLAEVVRLTRTMAAAKAEAFACSPYDALLDRYEPGGRLADIEAIFDDLAGSLPDFTERALAAQAAQDDQAAPAPLSGPFDPQVQLALCRHLMSRVGFPMDQGRLDISHHPFSGGTPDDLRITTRLDADDFLPALMATLHETGHALYEHGLPAAWRHQPVGRARGMSHHEGQSLLVEMQVCRGRAFLGFAAPEIAAAFGGTGPAWSADNLYRLVTRVRRGLIRVDADEVTYPAHIILRLRLEKALLSGDLAVADLPGAWRAGMRETVGISPDDDRDGCLQDIHWMDGAFGYFPTYTLGAMTAAQLFEAALADDPEIPAAIGRGDFKPLYRWLGPHIHAKGALLSSRELMIAASGRPLDAGAFKRHLARRYLEAA